MSRDRCEAAEREVYVLRQYKETHGDPEVLVNALKVRLRLRGVVITRLVCAQSRFRS